MRREVVLHVLVEQTVAGNEQHDHVVHVRLREYTPGLTDDFISLCILVQHLVNLNVVIAALLATQTRLYRNRISVCVFEIVATVTVDADTDRHGVEPRPSSWLSGRITHPEDFSQR